MSHVIDTNANTFEQDVIARSKEVPVVVDFWGPHCGPCHVLGPILEKLAEEADGKWVLAKVNTTENQQLAMDYRIQGIPAVKAFKDGEVIHEFVGALPRPDIERWLNFFVPNELDELAEEAKELMAGGEYNLAKEAWEELRAADPDDPRAKIGLAEVALASGDHAEAKKLLAAIPERLIDSISQPYSRVWIGVEAFGHDFDACDKAVQENANDSEARFQRAMLYAERGDYEEAFADLIRIVMVDREFRDDIARIGAVRLFDIVGIHSELATTWRTKLGRAMY